MRRLMLLFFLCLVSYPGAVCFFQYDAALYRAFDLTTFPRNNICNTKYKLSGHMVKPVGTEKMRTEQTIMDKMLTNIRIIL